MNKSYTLVWNQATGCWNVASEGTRRRSKSGRGKALVVAGASLLGLFCQAPAFALPSGATVVSGDAGFQTSTDGRHMVIDQQSHKLITNWNEFSVRADERVSFQQPGQDAVALNRVIVPQRQRYPGADRCQRQGLPGQSQRCGLRQVRPGKRRRPGGFHPGPGRQGLPRRQLPVLRRLRRNRKQCRQPESQRRRQHRPAGRPGQQRRRDPGATRRRGPGRRPGHQPQFRRRRPAQPAGGQGLGRRSCTQRRPHPRRWRPGADERPQRRQPAQDRRQQPGHPRGQDATQRGRTHRPRRRRTGYRAGGRQAGRQRHRRRQWRPGAEPGRERRDTANRAGGHPCRPGRNRHLEDSLARGQRSRCRPGKRCR